MHHDGTPETRQPTGSLPFFQIFNLKNKVMDASGDRITSRAKDRTGKKKRAFQSTVKEQLLHAVINVFCQSRR